MLAASALIDTIDIAFIMCFPVHKGSGCLSSSAIRSKSQTKTLRFARKGSPRIGCAHAGIAHAGS
jgi:hypothetical protein